MELRRRPRVLTFRTAKIVGHGAQDGTECAILNLAQDGACVLVPDAEAIPDAFHLQVDFDNWGRDCRVVWRCRHRAGVRFTDASGSDAG
jgi:hypothetical protein